MTTLVIIVIIVAIVAVVAVVGWFVFQRQNPEQAASHSQPDTVTTSERLSENADRSAGRDAESMDPDRLGGDHRLPT